MNPYGQQQEEEHTETTYGRYNIRLKMQLLIFPCNFYLKCKFITNIRCEGAFTFDRISMTSLSSSISYFLLTDH